MPGPAHKFPLQDVNALFRLPAWKMITSSCPPGHGSLAEAREQVNVHAIPPALTSGESHASPCTPSLHASVVSGVDTGLHVSCARVGLALRNDDRGHAAGEELSCCSAPY